MATPIDIDPERLQSGWTKQNFDRVLSVQRPVVLAHLRAIRRQHPDASPQEVARVLERRYLAAVTTAGAGAGAAAALPTVGTAVSLVISGVETVGFLEASALFAQSMAELHGLAVEDPERSSTLVMALMLGPAGANLVKQFAGEASGAGPTRAAYWGEMVTQRMPKQLLHRLTGHIRRRFLQRFTIRQSSWIVLRAVPFGVGAVLGGSGNHLAGRRVLAATRKAFGPAPAAFPDGVTVEPPRGSLTVPDPE
jgi:hypothetical protein